MVQEYDIPPPEGPIPMAPSRIRRFEDEDLPYDIGNLEREALEYLGDWNFVISRKCPGYGLVYRLGIKTIVDDEGDQLKLFLNFNLPFKKHELSFTEEALREYDETIRKISFGLSTSLSARFSNVAVVSTSPTEYMKIELEELLKTNTIEWPEGI